MESCASEPLTNTGPVHILSVDAQPWRVASPQDQSLLSQLSPGSLHPLTWLGEGAYGCVELCRVSVSIPITPRDEESPADQQNLALQQLSPNAAGECSAVSHRTLDSCDDRASGLRPTPRAEAAGLSSSSSIPAAAATAVAGETITNNTTSEAVLSPRERVVIRPGRFSVNRLRMSPQPHDPQGPQACATPHRTPPGYLTRLHLHSRHRPPSCSSGLAAAGCNGAAGGASPGAASGGWPATPSSTGTGRGLTPTDAAAAAGAFVSGMAAFYPRQRSSGSTTTLPTTATHSAPPSARSPGGQTPSQPPPSVSSPTATGAAAAAAAAVLSNELVVAVKRVGYRGPGARSTGGAREPDGCAAGCTGGAVGRVRAGNGPSRTRLNRMQAIELLQLARCRECPFIVRVFGCVPDDPRSQAVGGSAAGTASGGPTPKQSPRPSKLSPRRPAGAASSSSSPSCRIVMEWAEGGDLGSLLKTLSARRGPCSDPSRERLLMSESSARFYMACLLEALSFLHGKMLLHRDVKPANLLLTSDGRAKLGDLGMVCHLDRDGMAAGRAGTPNYMAPEVWAYGSGPKFSSYGANVDLWSAGVLLHELLTGHLPANHPDEYLKRNWTFVPRHAAFSPELRDLLTRLLTPRPRRRPQSCADVVAHPWFEGFDWQGLRDGTLPAPYVPAAHRPPGSGTVGAAFSAAARLRQPAGLAATAVGASGTSASPSVRGIAGELMPPLLEENGPHATSVAEGESGIVGPAAAASLSAGRSNQSGSAGAQSSPATATPAEPTAPGEAAGSRPHDGQEQLDAVVGNGCDAAAASATAEGAAPSSRILPMSLWRSLGWSMAASSRPGSGVASLAPSAPTSAVSMSVSAYAGAVAPSQSGWPRRGASHGSASVRGSDGSTAIIPRGGASGGAGGGGFGFISAALAMALSPLGGSSQPPSAACAVTRGAALAHAAVGSSGSSNGGSGASTSGPCPSAESQLVPVAPVGTTAGLVATPANAAPASSGGRGCEADDGLQRPCLNQTAEHDVACATHVANVFTSCNCNALLLGTVAMASATSTASASASDCAFVLRGDSRTSALGGRAGEGLRGGSSHRLSTAGASLVASYDSLQPSLPPTSSVETTAASGATIDTLSGPRAKHPCVLHPAAAPQPAPLPRGNLHHQLHHRPRGQSAGGLPCSSAAAAAPQAVFGSGDGLRASGRQPQPNGLSAAPACALSLVGALVSLQQHLRGFGPADRRAGSSLGWVQQRLADAAALAVALPDQLQSAAAAAAAAVGAGGAARATPSVAGRACRSEGGAAVADAHAGTSVASDAAVQRISRVSAVVGAVTTCGNPSPGSTPMGGAAGIPDDMAMSTATSAATLGSDPPRAASLSAPGNACRGDGVPSACCARQARRGAAGRAPPKAAVSTSTEWLRVATLRSATAGGATGDQVGRQSGVSRDDGTRPASSPPMLRQTPTQEQQQRKQQQNGRQDNLSDLDRSGSDVATVVVRVCTSGGGGGGGNGCVAAAAGAAAAVAASPVAEARGAVPEAAIEGPMRGGAELTGAPGGGDPRGASCTEVDLCGETRSGSKVVGAGPAKAHKDKACVRSVLTRSRSGPQALARSSVSISAAAATDTAVSASVAAATDVPRVPLVESIALPVPASSSGGAPHTPAAHRRNTSFAFDPLDQVRPTGQSSGSPATSSPSSFTQRRSLVRSHVRSHSFNFDVGGMLSEGLPLNGSPVALAATATAVSCNVGCGNLAAARDGACVAAGPAGSAQPVESQLAQPPRADPQHLRAADKVAGEEGLAAFMSMAALVGCSSQPAAQACRSAGAVPGRRRPHGTAAVATTGGQGHEWEPAAACPTQRPAARGSSGGGSMAHMQARHWQPLYTGEAAILLYMACVVMVMMAWAVMRHRGDAF